MNITAVSIARHDLPLDLSGIPFVCYTKGWKPIHGHDNTDLVRLQYITDRYNAAITEAISLYPETTHIFIIDSYYLPYTQSLHRLVRDYCDNLVLGASIWFEAKSHILSFIQYYDTMSVREFWGRRWKRESMPEGIIPVSGVGACWIFPRSSWAKSGGFSVRTNPFEMMNSRCIDCANLKVMLDCNATLWRTRADGADIPSYSPVKRIRVSLGEQKNKLLSRLPVLTK